MLASCRNANLLVFPSYRVHSEQSVQSVIPSHSILNAERSQTKWRCGNASTATAQRGEERKWVLQSGPVSTTQFWEMSQPKPKNRADYSCSCPTRTR
jgi:hypothetical protein